MEIEIQLLHASLFQVMRVIMRVSLITNLLSDYTVELPGFEPGSKQGDHTLSTCLALTCFSSIGRIKATDQYLISLISFQWRSIIKTNSEFIAPPVR